MEEFCQKTGSRYRHFFYGGAPGVAEDLAQQLHERHGIVVAGTYTPPFARSHPKKKLRSLCKSTNPQPTSCG